MLKLADDDEDDDVVLVVGAVFFHDFLILEEVSQEASGEPSAFFLTLSLLHLKQGSLTG